jgi:hypothetical protein
MICKHCGSSKDTSNKFCSNCNRELNDLENGNCPTEKEHNQTNEGFSRPNSHYIKAKVINKQRAIQQSSNNEKHEAEAINHELNQTLQLDNSIGLYQEQEVTIHQKLGHEITSEFMKRLHQQLETGLLQEEYRERQSEVPKEEYRERQSGLSQEEYQERQSEIQHGVSQEPQSKIHYKLTNKIRILRKLLIGISVTLLILIVLLICLRGNAVDGEYTFVSKDAIEVYYDRANSIAYVFNSKGEVLHKLEQSVGTYYTNDQTAAILFSRLGDQSYYVNSREMIKLNLGMRNYSMSENGKYIVYSVYSGINSFNLYLYDVDKHTEKLIDTIKDKQYDMINVLPDGKTVIYITATYPLNVNDYILESFILKIGNDPESLGKDILLIEASKDTKYLYYEKALGGGAYALYVKSEKGDVLLSSNVSNFIYLYFNKDRTEILFSDGERTYISANGNESVEVTDGLVSNIIVPKKSNVKNNLTMAVYSYGFDTFKNKVILCNNGLKVIDDKYQSRDLGYVTENQQIVMSEDGVNLIYRDADRNLMKVSRLNGECKQEIICSEIDDSFISSGDLSKIYYLKEKQLYYMNGNESPVMITNNVSDLCSNQAGDTAYFLKNYNLESGFLSLCYSKDGGEVEPVPGGNNVVGVKEWNFGVIYQKELNGIETVFYNTKGTKFNFLLEGVDFFEQKIKYVD